MAMDSSGGRGSGDRGAPARLSRGIGVRVRRGVYCTVPLSCAYIFILYFYLFIYLILLQEIILGKRVVSNFALL